MSVYQDSIGYQDVADFLESLAVNYPSQHTVDQDERFRVRIWFGDSATLSLCGFDLSYTVHDDTIHASEDVFASVDNRASAAAAMNAIAAQSGIKLGEFVVYNYVSATDKMIKHDCRMPYYDVITWANDNDGTVEETRYVLYKHKLRKRDAYAYMEWSPTQPYIAAGYEEIVSDPEWNYWIPNAVEADSLEEIIEYCDDEIHDHIEALIKERDGAMVAA